MCPDMSLWEKSWNSVCIHLSHSLFKFWDKNRTLKKMNCYRTLALVFSWNILISVFPVGTFRMFQLLHSWCHLLSWQTAAQQILSAPYSLWLTASSLPAALTGAFTSLTFGHLPLLRFCLHLWVDLPSGGQGRLQILPAAGLLDCPHLDRQWFQIWGTSEVELWVELCWTLRRIAAAQMMSECRGHRGSMATSLCQVSLWLFCLKKRMTDEQQRYVSLA